jgi:hypothetical protein
VARPLRDTSARRRRGFSSGLCSIVGFPATGPGREYRRLPVVGNQLLNGLQAAHLPGDPIVNEHGERRAHSDDQHSQWGCGCGPADRPTGVVVNATSTQVRGNPARAMNKENPMGTLYHASGKAA